MPPLPPHSPTGLYWNTRGNIRCGQHAIDISETSWQVEGWMPIPEHEAPHRRLYQCQKCSPDGNAIGR
jgi:hypothetical protein